MQVLLPKLTASMKEGIIVGWLKKPGDRVTKGEMLYQVETDKAVTDVEAPCDGVLTKIMRSQGKTPVNAVVAIIE
mgnify:CR=1 FL=1